MSALRCLEPFARTVATGVWVYTGGLITGVNKFFAYLVCLTCCGITLSCQTHGWVPVAMQACVPHLRIPLKLT